MDETQVKVHGKWCDVYRASEHAGHVGDSLVREKRNRNAAQPRFTQAEARVILLLITSRRMAILPLHVRYVRRWATPSSIGRIPLSLLGWSKTIVAASSGLILCVVVEQLRQRHACVVTRDEWRTDLRPRRTMGEAVSLLEQRQTFQKPLAAL